MANPNPSLERLQTLARQIAGHDLELLIHPASAGTYDFESVRTLIKFILGFHTDIASTDLGHVPDPVLDTMFNNASSVLSSFTEIKTFNYRLGDPNQASNQHLQNLKSRWREEYIYAAPHIALAKVTSSAIGQELNAIRSTANNIQSSWDSAAAEYKSQKEKSEKLLADRLVEFEKIIAAAREVSGKEAVSRQATEFEVEANQCLRASRFWFGATIGAVVISLVVVYAMFLKIPQLHQAPQQTLRVVGTNQTPAINTTAQATQEAPTQTHSITAELLQQTVARILIVTLLYSSVVWFARNYFASRHNYTVNRHRRNAMQTFRAFVEGTKDVSTQDFILRQAAACAFSPQQSGYLKDESLPAPTPSSPVIDFVRPTNP